MRPPHTPTAWRVGETVPWSVSWTAEREFELQASVDFPGFTELVQVQRPGIGMPVFGVLHVTRHRLGMVRYLCHVCGRPTSKRDRYLFPLESGGPVTLADGEIRYGGNVPRVHLACARRAASQCPHLKGSSARPAPFPSDPGRLIQRTDVAPGLEAFA